MDPNDAKSAVQSWLADAQIRKVQDYVSRGRHLEHIPEQDLAAAWVELMRAWAASPGSAQDPRRVDIESEHSVRGLKPPYELAKAELDVVAREAAKLVGQMDESVMKRIDRAVSEQIPQGKTRKH